MSMETLQTLRVFIPGVMILFVSLPLFQRQLDTETILGFLSAVEGLFQVAMVTVLGSLYYISGIRDYVLKKSRNQIDNNIKTQLLAPFQDEPIITDAAEELRKGYTLMDVFYEIVDNDKSLTQRANRVRLNGLLWSSMADMIVVSFFAILVYMAAYLFTCNNVFCDITLIMLGVQIASQLLLPKLTKKHMELSQRQLDFIHVHYLDKVREKLLHFAKERISTRVSPE